MVIMKRHWVGALAGAALFAALPGPAAATPALRRQVTQKGDFVLLGNTLGQDCSPHATFAGNPVVGTVGPCPAATSNYGPDVFWEADFPAPGMATASTAITLANARSTAVLSFPATAVVTQAYLYWGARPNVGNMADLDIVVDRPGVGAFSSTVTAIGSATAVGNTINGQSLGYQSVADVTALVLQNGPGAYRVSGVDSLPVASFNTPNLAVGWWMVVFYQDSTLPLRQLTLFDGLDYVNNMTGSVSATLSGFLIPPSGYTAHLGVVAYDGDTTVTGDKLLWNGVALSDAMNPVNDFFNGTRSYLGSPVSNVGDLPQLSGTPGSMSELDLDVVDITPNVAPNQTSANVTFTSAIDSYFVGGFITSITTLAPDLSSSTKTVTDLTAGGGPIHAGDVLQYTITVSNTGSDPAVNTVLTDVVPTGTTYVPGSLQVTAGANLGPKTDAAADDQGDFNAGTGTVTFRLGTGANGSMGGALPIGGSSTVTFQVKINAGATGTITNQGTATAAGQSGAPATAFPTDGNGPTPGSPPTGITIASCPVAMCACMVDSDCGGPSSGTVCDNGAGGTFACVPGCRGTNGNGCMAGLACTSTTNAIGACVTCTTDAQCGSATSGQVCNTSTNTCQPGCRGMGGNGCPTAQVCTSPSNAIGACVQCLVDATCGGATSGFVCNGATHACQPGCRGMNGNGCPAGDVCTSPNATIGACVQCTLDAQCGGAMSGFVCNGATQTCQPGCRGTNGNGCPTGAVCTSPDATIGSCVQCSKDADCGGPMSGAVCNAATSACGPGCRGMNGNGCPTNQACTSMDATVGTCVQCVTDANCGGPASGQVCDATTHQCGPGCRGTGGNGCPTSDVCTSTTAAVGMCVQCTSDASCGTAMSGQVCDASTSKCQPGCRGMGGNGCPTADVCTSMDATIGMCVQCTSDANCGAATSGLVCNPITSMCQPGCRGTGGNGCPGAALCTSVDATIGMCVQCTKDADCGAAMSGKVCDATTNQCGPGCRGMGGNGCPTGDVCTSQDTGVGMCVQCTKDANCGGPSSGAICDAATSKCGPGCRGMGGNGCPTGQLCTSVNASAGTCHDGMVGTGGAGGSGTGTGTGGNPNDGITASGNGLFCAAQPGRGDEDAGAWLLGGLAGVLLASRRRRRR